MIDILILRLGQTTIRQLGHGLTHLLIIEGEHFGLLENHMQVIDDVKNILGMYIPYTASAIISGEVAVPEDDRINIKGILIGNGVLVMNDQFRDKAATSFLTRRNFIDKTNQFILDHQCNINANSASCKLAK